MLIERMHTNPEDFEFGGRLRDVATSGELSDRDKTAIRRAYEEMIVEPKLSERVLTALLAPRAEAPRVTHPGGVFRTQSGFNGTSWTDPAGIYGSPLQAQSDQQMYAQRLAQANVAQNMAISSQGLTIGGERLDGGMLRTIKNKLGL